jgi:HD-GYP domain-containing protein (c-di-GMP phosphodiesterase class II)
MYLQKAGGRSSAARQVTEVVLSLLNEHEPGREASLRELAGLTQEVGSCLGLSDGELLALRRATLLHRIGLSAVPSAILQKVVPLTPDEHDFIRGHTLIAERVLAAAPSLRTVALLVRATSESFDGSGHPDGLDGQSIPLASRIIRACASYTAMIQPRPYRMALSHEAALLELQRCAGTQFDPAVVAALRAVLQATVGAAKAIARPADPGLRNARLSVRSTGPPIPAS